MTVKTLDIQSIIKDLGITGSAAVATQKYLEGLLKAGNRSSRDIELSAGGFLMAG